MTIDETIKELTDWAKDNRKEQNYWAAERNESYDETNPLSYADCEGFERDAEERAEYHEQIAEWLMELKDLRAEQNDQYVFIHELMTELKDLREENEALTSECDRLIKEKGELLSKVSGGDVLRICQLEEHLEKAKRLLKAAMKDMNTLYETGKDEGCIGIKFKWRFADEALKLIES